MRLDPGAGGHVRDHDLPCRASARAGRFVWRARCWSCSGPPRCWRSLFRARDSVRTPRGSSPARAAPAAGARPPRAAAGSACRAEPSAYQYLRVVERFRLDRACLSCRSTRASTRSSRSGAPGRDCSGRATTTTTSRCRPAGGTQGPAHPGPRPRRGHGLPRARGALPEGAERSAHRRGIDPRWSSSAASGSNSRRLGPRGGRRRAPRARAPRPRLRIVVLDADANESRETRTLVASSSSTEVRAGSLPAACSAVNAGGFGADDPSSWPWAELAAALGDRGAGARVPLARNWLVHAFAGDVVEPGSADSCGSRALLDESCCSDSGRPAALGAL